MVNIILYYKEVCHMQFRFSVATYMCVCALQVSQRQKLQARSCLLKLTLQPRSRIQLDWFLIHLSRYTHMNKAYNGRPSYTKKKWVLLYCPKKGNKQITEDMESTRQGEMKWDLLILGLWNKEEVSRKYMRTLGYKYFIRIYWNFIEYRISCRSNFF